MKCKQGGKITNPEGVTDGDAWDKPLPWVNFTGPATAGIALLNRSDPPTLPRDKACSRLPRPVATASA